MMTSRMRLGWWLRAMCLMLVGALMVPAWAAPVTSDDGAGRSDRRGGRRRAVAAGDRAVADRGVIDGGFDGGDSGVCAQARIIGPEEVSTHGDYHVPRP